MSSHSRGGCKTGTAGSKSAGRGTLSRWHLFKRFSRNQDGVMAIEFAFLALPFIGTLFAILEIALMFSAGQMLESGVNTAARMIRTGQVQAQGLSSSAFKDLVCANIPGILDCQNGLKVDVRSFENFGGITLPATTDDDGELIEGAFTFVPGNPSEVVVVRAYYAWSLILPGKFSGLSNMAGNKRMLASAATFRNEPFVATTN